MSPDYPAVPMVSPARSPRPRLAASLQTEERTARRLADAFFEQATGEVAVSVAHAGGGRWRVTFYVTGNAEARLARELAGNAGIAAPPLRFRRVDAADWVKRSLAGLRPVEAGRFVVHGGHDRARVAPNRIGIEIEAALAFGTGHHGTTRGCLLALGAICKARSRAAVGRILDLGTGSGVLAIAAARALRRPVLATDIDPQAVDAARKNARRNGVGALVEVVHADGLAGLRRRAPFDLVVANILLQPLQRFATALTQELAAPGARIVLSGILPAQANAIVAAYHRLTLQRRIDCDGWTTLVFARRPTLPSTRRSC